MITRSEAARRLDVSKQRLDQIVDQVPRPLFFIKDKKKNKWGVDDAHPAWLALVKQYEEKSKQKDRRKKEEKGLIKVPPAKVPHDFKKRAREAAEKALSEELGDKDDISVLNKKSILADLEKKIYQNIIAREKSIQEEVRTLELKKELVPIGLMKHWYSFAESMISRIGRRPGEIEAELEALFRGGEKQLATDKIKRELEAIVIEVHKELVEDIRKEGYKMPEKDEGGTGIEVKG